MTEQQKYEWIEQYLLGELSGDRLQSFETRLRNDADFVREVDFHRELLAAVSDAEAVAFRQKVDRLQEKIDRKEAGGPSGSKNKWNWWLLFVVIVIILMAFFLYFRQRNQAPDTPQAIYAYAERQEWPVYPDGLFPDVLFPGEQRRLDEPDMAAGAEKAGIREVKAAYAETDYETALEKLEQLSVENVGANRLFFYRGLLQMRSGQPAEAALSFERVGAEGPFADPARWNRALSLIAAGRPDVAVPLLESFAGSNYKAEEARRLLEFLGR